MLSVNLKNIFATFFILIVVYSIDISDSDVSESRISIINEKLYNKYIKNYLSLNLKNINSLVSSKNINHNMLIYNNLNNWINKKNDSDSQFKNINKNKFDLITLSSNKIRFKYNDNKMIKSHIIVDSLTKKVLYQINYYYNHYSNHLVSFLNNIVIYDFIVYKQKSIHLCSKGSKYIHTYMSHILDHDIMDKYMNVNYKQSQELKFKISQFNKNTSLENRIYKKEILGANCNKSNFQFTRFKKTKDILVSNNEKQHEYIYKYHNDCKCLSSKNESCKFEKVLSNIKLFSKDMLTMYLEDEKPNFSIQYEKKFEYNKNTLKNNLKYIYYYDQEFNKLKTYKLFKYIKDHKLVIEYEAINHTKLSEKKINKNNEVVDYKIFDYK